MLKKKLGLSLVLTAGLLSACGSPAEQADNGGDGGAEAAPVFADVSVHDPSVIKVKDTYYVFGSHLASAKSKDLMSWTQISDGVADGNPLIPNVTTELSETLGWAQSDTLWAPDVIQLADGKFYMYYNACKGDSPLSAMGIAVSNKIKGPYKNKGIILKSGMNGISDDGTVYNANKQPNVVDPDVFFDKNGELWMVYGSYSGGIFVLKLDPKTGEPLKSEGYGKKVLGGYHARIEGPYMLYSPETDYYYLFLSFGGLTADGGYNIRVARSKSPDGPFTDAQGQDMIEAQGTPGVLFDDPAYAPYGVKLMGNFEFQPADNEKDTLSEGYVSPGHNSAYYDEDTGKYYLIFHTRFPGRGEEHEVRVHQMFMNEKGWPVVAPHRYAGETIGDYKEADTAGSYKMVNHGKDISAETVLSEIIELKEDGTVTGAVNGTWSLKDGHKAVMNIDGTEYDGVFLREWDEGTQSRVMTFTVQSEEGVSIWGSHVK
ncbi:glycoside hydrolase family 43 protein [Paenibacillus sp. HN-1]|uniref:glycoside hydrolase family 43 protein n=1 Tax=Paenibacillus TaxID=44249 RepID=UPI001CA97CD2|nr:MULTISPECIES: glycoside hydrolase family 43 protein [Paenibacillus]MBY9078382.1 glycoside hydrolase family 43 protein [Paenibacillus sp. CGMCC 1.18879]MBY9087903.1 glycoside hydrolase family 43 protein [Paenibacillus sinensis]